MPVNQPSVQAEQEHDRRPPRLVVMPWPRLLTIEQAASYLGLSAQTIRNRKNLLPGRKLWGAKPVYDRVALDRLIDENNGVSDLWIDAGRITK